MTKIQMIKTRGIVGLFLSLEHLLFEIVSRFEIRISSFVNVSQQIMPAGLKPKPDPQGQGLLLKDRIRRWS